MESLTRKSETLFEALASYVYLNRIKVLVMVLLFSGALSSQLPTLKIDTSNESFLHKDDPIIVNYQKFKEQFGRDELILIALQTPDIFNQKFLKILKQLHEELEEKVPSLDSMTSLINARSIRGEEDELIVEGLMEEWPEDEQALEQIKSLALSNPLYKNMLLSEDGKITTIILQLDAFTGVGEDQGDFGNESIDQENTEDFADEDASRQSLTKEPEILSPGEKRIAVNTVNQILEKYEGPNFKIYLAGSLVVADLLKRTMIRDMGVYTGLALLTISIVLFIIFRRVTGFIFPLLVVLLPLTSTLGMMALVGAPFTLVTQILPSFLLAVGIGDSVHILALFYRHYDQTGDKQKATVYAVGHSGVAILMTSLTTAGALASFIPAEVAPIGEFGKYSALGVIFALLYTLVLLPALLSLIPIKQQPVKESQNRTWIDRILIGCGDLATRYPWQVIFGSTVLIIIALLGIFQLRFYHSFVHWFPKEAPMRTAVELLDREMKGSFYMEVVINTGKENGIYDPEFMRKLDEMGRYVEQLEYHDGALYVGQTVSIADILKEINQALNENQSEHYVIPTDRNLIAQEFLLFENSGSDDLEDMIDSQFSMARFTVKASQVNASGYLPLINDVKKRFQKEFGDKVQVVVTGSGPMFARTATALIKSMITSYLLAAGVITILMIVFIRNFKLGILCMVPNLTPILLTLGVMGWFHLNLDVFTILIGSIVIGIAVDDTIHFMHNFKRYFKETGNARNAVIQTLETTGRAMLCTTIVLSSGFFLFMFASLENLFAFGLLAGLAILLALLSDLLLASALVTVTHRSQERYARQPQTGSGTSSDS